MGAGSLAPAHSPFNMHCSNLPATEGRGAYVGRRLQDGLFPKKEQVVSKRAQVLGTLARSVRERAGPGSD